MPRDGEVFINIIGRVKGMGTDLVGEGDKEKERLKLELEESNGKSFTWSTTWDKKPYREGCETGKVYEFEVSMMPNTKEGGKGYFRNLRNLVGAAEMPARGEMTSYLKDGQPIVTGASTTSNGNQSRGGKGMSDYDRTKERASIESQVSVKSVIAIMEAGYKIDEVADVLTEVLKQAGRIEEHLAGVIGRRGIVDEAPAAKPQTQAKSSSASKAKPAPKEGELKNAGDLMNAIKAEWGGKPQSEVLATLGVDSLANVADVNDAFNVLKAAWSPEGPPAQEAA